MTTSICVAWWVRRLRAIRVNANSRVVVVVRVMSEEAERMLRRCASCGIAESGDVKLMKCTGCYLVRYCGIECQKKHRKEHKRECTKRAAELRDELLFKQPESSHRGDCPICCLPHSLTENPALSSCCSKRICNGCLYANLKRESEGGLDRKCLFCRSELSLGEEFSHEAKKNLTKRLEANDLVALYEVGARRYGEGDYVGALECFTKAVEFGNDAGSHYYLSLMYHNGEGVEKDEKRSCTIWKRQPLVEMPVVDTILDVLRTIDAGWIEQ